MPTLTDHKLLPISIDPQITGYVDQFKSTLERTNPNTTDQFMKDYLRNPSCTVDGKVLEIDEIKKISENTDIAVRTELLKIYLRKKNISEKTIDILTTKHDQTEFGIYALYTQPTFMELGFAGGQLSPRERVDKTTNPKSKDMDFTYQADSPTQVTLTTEVRGFGGQILKDDGVDFTERSNVFGGRDVTQTVNTYTLKDGQWDVSRALSTNSPIFAADLVLGYLKREKEFTATADIRNQMIFYIAQHPNFPMEVSTIPSADINQRVAIYAAEHATEMDSFIKKTLPEEYLDDYCNQKIARLTPKNKMFKPSPLIAEYEAIKRLGPDSKKAIVEAMEKDPEYLEKHFMIKEIFKKMRAKMFELKRNGILDFDYKDEDAKKLIADIKAAGNDFTDMGIAKNFTAEEPRYKEIYIIDPVGAKDKDRVGEKSRMNCEKGFSNYVNPLIEQLKQYHAKEQPQVRIHTGK
jgi:hypothetical protein